MRHVEKDGKLWVESKTFGVAEMEEKWFMVMKEITLFSLPCICSVLPTNTLKFRKSCFE